ncbi:stalk domain-containing protein [Paenibacillus sp. UMB4589-SE434]|uniref:stalk domain-containing protein n=1 Tax=Paenibacillus sp. UMB4589-SE434 TaxID=3046314 RepID=UPI002551BD12|nr:stalk domain-containing protein [Paenibacillus sp. UMB4589-SE434]MDK8183217.1 hypothetical protein [Paenibacillus sp. UMB4589-SE434]
MGVKRIPSLAWIALFCSLIIVMSVNGQMATAEDVQSNYVIKFEGKVARDAEVYLKDGRTYVPFKFLTHALGLNVNFSQFNEEYVYHNYETQHNNKAVRVWGNLERGYWIQTRPLGQEDSPYGTKISGPTYICKPETDNCTLDEKKYHGPFVRKGTLYVPVRDMSKVFDLNINVQRTGALTIVDLQSKIK